MQRVSSVRKLAGVNRSYRKTAKKAYKKTRKIGKKKGWSKKKIGLKTLKRYRAKLAGCTAHYVESQYNPFKSYPGGVCIPDFISMPSYKFSTKARGNATFNSSGCCYVMMNPYIIFNDLDGTVAGGSNQYYQAPIWASNGGNNMGSPTTIPSKALTDPATTLANVQSAANPYYWDSPVTTAAAKAALAGDGKWDWRPVSAGIKVKYAGDVMARKGQIVLFEEPTNSETLSTNNQTQAGLLQRVEAAFSAFGDGEYAVTYHPRNLSDLDYVSSWAANLADRSGWLSSYPVLLIAIFGGPPNETVVFEAMCHWEITGSAVPSRTKSHSDPNGFGAAQGIIPEKPSLTPPTIEGRKKLVEAEHALNDTSSSTPHPAPPGTGLYSGPLPPSEGHHFKW